MPRRWLRALLFLSSYAPLWLMLAIQCAPKDIGKGFESGWLLACAIGFCAVAVVSLLVLWLHIRKVQQTSPHRAAITAVQHKDSEAMRYIASYLLPFLSFSFTDWRMILCLAAFVGVIGVIYVHSNMVYINPVLSFRGYHLYEVTYDSGKVAMLLCKRQHVPTQTSISVVDLGDNAIMEKEQG